MDHLKNKPAAPAASRRNVLLGLVAGAGVAAAATGPRAEAQEETAPKSKGPVLFKRTAETERYYKTLLSK